MPQERNPLWVVLVGANGVFVVPPVFVPRPASRMVPGTVSQNHSRTVWGKGRQGKAHHGHSGSRDVCLEDTTAHRRIRVHGQGDTHPCTSPRSPAGMGSEGPWRILY